MIKYSIVVPFHNEEENCTELYDRLKAVMETAGEDFELVFAVPLDDGQRLVATQPIAGITLAHIGECVADGLWIEENGQGRPLPPTGYVHTLD